MSDALPSRIASRFMVDEASGCWPWTGYRNPKGYGKVNWDGGHRMAHRVVYELMVGPIPPGLQIDHLCRNRCCVNPAHLEPVTNRTNVLRGKGSNAVAHMTNVCVSGRHFLSGDNVYIHPQRGRRECRACRDDRQRQRRAS